MSATRRKGFQESQSVCILPYFGQSMLDTGDFPRIGRLLAGILFLEIAGQPGVINAKHRGRLRLMLSVKPSIHPLLGKQTLVAI